MWSVIVSLALGAATIVFALAVDNDMRSLAEMHNLPLEDLPIWKVFFMFLFGVFTAAFAFANAALLFRNVKVWLRKISINKSSSTYKFHC